MFKQPETKPEPGAPKARNLNLDSLCKTQIVLFNGHNMITNVKSNDPAEFETHTVWFTRQFLMILRFNSCYTKILWAQNYKKNMATVRAEVNFILKFAQQWGSFFKVV